MTCAEFEILLADYLDGALAAEQRAAVEAHLSGCASCSELARDAEGMVAFLDRAAEVEPPPALVHNILAATARIPSPASQTSWTERFLGRWFGVIFQPRFAMGAAMAVLSIAILARFSQAELASAGARHWNAASVNPMHVLVSAQGGLERAWDRTVKHYENQKLVYQVQAQLEEWNQESQMQDLRRQEPPTR